MKKFIVSVYYSYRAQVVVEAEDANQALTIGYDKAIDVPTEDLTYIETIGADVLDENRNIIIED